MKIRQAAGIIFTVIAIAAVVAWFTVDHARLFIASLAIVTLTAYALLLSAAWLIVSALILLLLPAETKSFYRTRRARLRLIVLACGVLFVAVGLVMNKLWLPGRTHPLSLTADAAWVVLTALIGWALLKPERRRVAVLLPAGIVFVLMLGAFSILGPGGGTSSDEARAKALATLPYLTWVPTDGSEGESGVVYHDVERTADGFNIYNPSNLSTAFLMNNDGDIVHEWTAGIDGERAAFSHIEMLPDGDLLAILDGETRIELVRLDWNSNAQWRVEGGYHHDIATSDDGDIYSLLHRDEILWLHGRPMPIINEYLEVLSPAGEAVREISLLKLLEGYIPASRVTETYKWLLNYRNFRAMVDVAFTRSWWLHGESPPNVFHANSVEIIERDVSDILRQGYILFCVRNMDRIGVIDPQAERVVWSWGPGELQRPHHPTLLDNGNILIFDNGPWRGYSRIVELNPATESIEWEYKSDPPDDFFSYSRGGNQRLPNGNTLITNSNSGQAFEVTREGEMVWEFYNPVAREKAGSRAAIYRLMRLDPADYPVLARLRGE